MTTSAIPGTAANPPTMDPPGGTGVMEQAAVAAGFEHVIEEAPVVHFLAQSQQWAFPDDLPYSFIEFPADIDLQYATQTYANAVDAYRAIRQQVSLARPEPVQMTDRSEGPPPQVEPSGGYGGPPSSNTGYGTPPPQQQQQGPTLFCPEHRQAVTLSKQEYQKYDTMPDGQQVPSRYFHKLDQPYFDQREGKQVNSHSLWRRELVHQDGSLVEQARQGA